MASERKDSEDNSTGTEALHAGHEPAPRKFSLELGGEMVLLLICVVLFARFIYEAIFDDWGSGAAIMPWIVSTAGLLLVAVRFAMLLTKKSAKKSSQIMDTGFSAAEDDDSAEVRERFIRISAFIILLYVGIWFIGFHVALPLGVAIYLKKYGGVGWLGVILTAAFFAGIIVGVYDQFVNMFWPEPMIRQLLDF